MSSGPSTSVLPKSSREFALPEYWDQFFKRDAGIGVPFEWYGSYQDLKDVMEKYLRRTDKILIVGCGNSDVSSKLFYDGYKDQVSIDISPVVIDQMKEMWPRIEFRIGDVTKLDFDDNTFTCIFDKGTFDALTPPPKNRERQGEIKNEESLSHYMSLLNLDDYTEPMAMLSEINRVIKPMGRFICVSLLQSHVAKLLVTYFYKEGWMIRIVKCPEPEGDEKGNQKKLSNFIVYVCIFTKLNVPGKEPIIELSITEDVNAKPVRYSSLERLFFEIYDLRKMTVMKRKLTALGACDPEFFSTLLDSDGNVRFNSYTIDIPKFFKNDKKKLFAILITPPGRETEYTFGTKEGRMELALKQGYARLVFLELVRGQKYPNNLSDLEPEVTERINILMPADFLDSGVKAPILTVSDEKIGERNVVFEGTSDFSGDFVVEDVDCGGEGETKISRRLIFLNAPNVIQSEVVMRPKPKTRRGGRNRNATTNSGSSGTKNTFGNSGEIIPVPSVLGSVYHANIGVGYGFLKIMQKVDEKDTLLIGLGGGLLVGYLFRVVPELTLTAVEIDPVIVEIATKYFGLEEYGEGKRLNVIVEDGLKYIRENDKKYNFIILDVDNKHLREGLSCPPPEFLELDFLQNVKERLAPKGIFVVNLVCRAPRLKDFLLNNLGKPFPFVWHYDVPDDLNTICFCFSEFSYSPRNLKSMFDKSLSYIDSFQREKKTKQRKAMDEIDNIASDVGVFDMYSKFKYIRNEKN